jgi:purine-binding chemotaxis protein CheW
MTKNSISITKETHKSTTRQFLLFSQAESLFSLELNTVREVLFLTEQGISPVPNTSSFLLGLTNLRGEILAVADWGRLIGVAPVDFHSHHSRILIIEAPDPRDVRLPLMRMGLGVSRVEGVLSVNTDRIVSAVEVPSELAPFLKGLYNYDGRLLMIVDVEAIAQSERW